MQLVFDNEHFVAVDKPAAWLAVPSRKGEADPRPCLGRILSAQLDQRLWPIHRLDAEVSGLILFAKNAVAHTQANTWFETRLVRKYYQALTEGDQSLVPEGNCIWQSRLVRGKKRAFAAAYGKPSETLAHAVGTVVTAVTAGIGWHLEPRTGRSHQLRYELAHHGFPIIGDELYGAKTTYGDATHTIALRCVRLAFSQCPGATQLGLPEELSVSALLPAPTQSSEVTVEPRARG